MSTSSIGVQRILPRRGPGWQAANSQAARSDTAKGDHAIEGEPDRAPSEPGTGHIVDRKA